VPTFHGDIDYLFKVRIDPSAAALRVSFAALSRDKHTGQRIDGSTA